MQDRKKIIKILSAALGTLLTAAVAAFSVYFLWEQAPEVEKAPETLAEHIEEMPAATPAAEKKRQDKPGTDKGTAFDTNRRDGIYTMLLVGNDDGTGNTDTIMVGKLDTVRHTMSFVSIPRDTIINTDWSVRKINSVYWSAVNHGGVGIQALRKQVKKLTGFEVDCYAVIDLDAFERAVDAMGGIWFDVPQPMYYEDWIALEPGYQLLNGHQAMGLCRFRSDYTEGDIGRIEMQHAFLKAAAEQFIELGNIPDAPAVIKIIAESTDTNLTAPNIAYFFRQALMCSPEDIRFYTAPHTPAYVHDLSYAFIDLYDWLNMVNEQINPFDTAVSEGDLELVYLYNGNVCCTGVLNDPGYYRLGSPGGAQEDAAAPEDGGESYEQLSGGEPAQPEFVYDELFAPAEDSGGELTEDSGGEPAVLMGDDWLVYQ